jgi:hypothetical protein
MEIWYRAGGARRFSIEPVEAERLTASSIYIRGRQYRLHTSYECYFKTWEEARTHLVQKYQHDVDLCQAQLRRAENDLAQARAISRPRTIEFGWDHQRPNL